MSHMYQVPEARVLYAALFMHYLIFGFLWLVDACKSQQNAEGQEDMSQNQTELQQHNPYTNQRKAYDQTAAQMGGGGQHEGGEKENQTKAPPEQEVDMENIDVQLEDDDGDAPEPAGQNQYGSQTAGQNRQYAKNQFDSGSSTENVGPAPIQGNEARNATSSVGLRQEPGPSSSFPGGQGTFQQDHRNPTRVLDPSPTLASSNSTQNSQQQFARNAVANDPEEDELNEFNTIPFLQLISKNYHKSTVWFSVLVALCAMRAANGFTVWLSWICLFFRVGQIAAAAIKSEKAAWVVYAAVTFIMVMLFFSEMISEGADIVHEAEPTDQMKRNVQIFAKNYDSPY